MRRRPTDHEAKIWRWLRGRRFAGYKFHRQYPVWNYILDFYCDALKLAIEVDGSWHTRRRDAARTAVLNREGIHVLRITNREIDRDGIATADYILATIRLLEERRTLPQQGANGNKRPEGGHEGECRLDERPSPAAPPHPLPRAGEGIAVRRRLIESSRRRGLDPDTH